MKIMQMFGLTKKQVLFFLVLIIAGIVTAFAVTKSNPQNKELQNLIGKEFTQNTPLPNLNFQDYQTKQDYTNDLKNGKVLIVYLVTSCFGCQKESEVLSTINFAKDKNIKIYGIADENNEELKNFVQNHNFRFPLIFDEGSKFRNAFNIKYFPANFVVENGVVVKNWFGNPKDKDELYQRLGLTESK